MVEKTKNKHTIIDYIKPVVYLLESRIKNNIELPEYRTEQILRNDISRWGTRFSKIDNSFWENGKNHF